MSNWGSTLYTGYNTIRHVGLKYIIVNIDGENPVNFWHLEAESSVRIEAIARPTDQGFQRVVAYKLTLTAYVPNNEYVLVIHDLEEIRNRGAIESLLIGMGSAVKEAPEANGFLVPTLEQGSTPLDEEIIQATLAGVGLTNIIVETIERRMRAVLTFEAYYTKKLFEQDIASHFFSF